MRRGLASLIIGLSLIVASLSWASFTLSRTVLDPGRSERLADQLLENPDVRQALVLRMADALEAQIPSEVPVPRGVIEAGAATALDDPRVEELIRDGFVRVHQNALAGVDEPVSIDASALGAAGRDVLVELRPELEPFLPPTPPLEVELPTTGLSWIGSVKNVVDRFTGISALVALIGAVTAFVVAKNRAAVLRRVAFWGYGASAFWLALGYGIPYLAANLSPTSAAIATASADVFFGAMVRPAIIMAVIATALLLLGFLLPALQRRRGATAMQPRGRTGRGGTYVPAGSYGPGPAAAAPNAVSPNVLSPNRGGQAPTAAYPPGQVPPGPWPIDRTQQLPVRPAQGITGQGLPMQPTMRVPQQPVAASQPPQPPPTVPAPPERSVLYGSDPAATTRLPGSDDQPAAEAWRPAGSADSTDQMPTPDWDERPD